MSSQTRRDRPSRTCQPCKRRKVRCDRTRPTCAECSKVRITCSYDDDESRPRARNFEFIDETSKTTAEASGFRSLGQEETNGTPIIGQLSQQPGGRMRYVEPSFWAYNKDETDPLDVLLAAMNRYDIQDIPEDKEDDLEPSQSSRASTVSGIATPSRRTAPYRLTGDFASPSPAWTPASLSTSRLQRQATNPLTLLPPKAICDRLFDFYLEGYHYIFPMIHSPSFKTEYASIWDPQPNPQKSMHFVCLLLAILFAGAAACPNREVLEDLIPADETNESLATSIREKGLKALQQANFPKTPTLETLTAYIILQVTWMKEEEPLTTCAFVGLAYRVAQMLGLHHDPSRFSSLSRVVCETRRRVWWVIVHVDVAVGLAAGLPPLIDLSTCDVWPVSELSEELFDIPPGNLGSNLEVSVTSVCFAGRIRDILVTRHVLSKIYGHHALSRQDIMAMRAKCRALTADLASKINMIPKSPLLRVDGIPVSYEMASEKSSRNIEAYTRLFFSAMIDKTWFLACHPVLKEAIHGLWKEMYPQALEHCRYFLYKIAQLSCFEEFQHFQWNWPGAHQPLHALITLLHSLLRLPRSDLAPTFRHALDTVFALCGPSFNGGIVASTCTIPPQTRQRPLTEGGIECWTLLWRMRARAWMMIGLDPDIIPTREQALESLYELYARQGWDEGRTMVGDEAEMDRQRTRSSSSQAQTSASMSGDLGLPPQPPQGQQLFAVAPDANPFLSISHHAQDGNLGTGVGGAEVLSDPNIPAPNVDLMFWDQMLQEDFFGHGHPQVDGRVYGMGDGNFGGGGAGNESADFGGSGSGWRGSRMEGDIDFQGGAGGMR
ncbi:uncharacterized protein LY89DRAFT_719842 [Mollisia scopiformis]|uniref:Zn(2)-C6 fungal-type domain-containing protein n=1 Tax=Mollisia scopiformis TaxID=149040 RepID=A0A194X4Z8_MOLSC|nr:uncharacterized protein LY89DRAFT_719842 [Mollisia scopiformis]KUJ15253.1 hypothetical protein LY89DRAFT_719842 [Mollisia scopiformis]